MYGQSAMSNKVFVGSQARGLYEQNA